MVRRTRAPNDQAQTLGEPPSQRKPAEPMPRVSADAASAAPARRKGQRHDWEAIERDYRTGRFTLKELEAKHGAGYADISRRSSRFGWTKDLREAVRAATSAAVIAEVAKAEAKRSQTATTNVVEATAASNAQVVLGHIADAKQMRDVTLDLLGELRATTRSPRELENLLKLAAGGDPEEIAAHAGAARELLTLHRRANSMQKLADTLSKLQRMERIAHDLGDGEGAGGAGLPPPIADPSLPPERAYLVLIGAAGA